MAGRIEQYLEDADAYTISIYLPTLLLYYPATETELESLSRRLILDDTIPPAQVPLLFFAQGLAGWRLADVTQLQAAIERLQTIPDTSDIDKHARSLTATLTAIRHWMRGSESTALTVLEKARYPSPPGFGANEDQAIARFVRGEILLSEGEFEEAGRWFQSVITGGSVHGARTRLAGPSLFRTGQCYDRLGKTEQAIHYYTRFADLWGDADERLQPWVREARESLDRLLEDQIREPG